MDKVKIQKKIETICRYYNDIAERKNISFDRYDEIRVLIKNELKQLFDDYKIKDIDVEYFLNAEEKALKIKINYPDCSFDFYRISFVNKEVILKNILDRVQQINILGNIHDSIKNIIEFLKEQKKLEMIDSFNINVIYNDIHILFPKVIVSITKNSKEESTIFGATD